MVGLSLRMNDSNVDAPIRSPAAANTVSGFCARKLLDRPGQHRGTGLGTRRVAVDPAVEVVDAEDLDLLDRRRRPLDPDDLRVVVGGRGRDVDWWKLVTLLLKRLYSNAIDSLALMFQMSAPVTSPWRPRWRARGPATRTGRRSCRSSRPATSDSMPVEARVVEDLHRVLLGVGVEVTREEDALGATRRREGVRRTSTSAVGLARAVAVEGALAVAGVDVVVAASAAASESLLDLKWLTTTTKASASGAPSALNAWASGSRALANAGRVDQHLRRADPGHGVGVEDERGADHVLVRDGGSGRPAARGRTSSA